MEEIHNMYDLPIVPPLVHRECVQVEEVELDEAFHNVEEVPSMTLTQSQIGYGYSNDDDVNIWSRIL